MPGTLFLRLAADPDRAAWVCLDEHGRQLEPPQQGSLMDAGPLARESRVVVLVPAMQIVTTLVSVPPTRNTARLRQMLPYTLEETLAQDVDELFFALGARRDGEVAVSVVARERLEAWLKSLAEAGIGPVAICSEAEGVPDTPGALTLIAEDERIFGGWAGQAPFVFEGLGLAAVVELVTGSSGTDNGAAASPNILLYADHEAHVRHQRDCAVLATTCTSFELRLLDQGPLPRLATTLHARPGTNLLQGEYAPRSNWVPVLRPWRFAAGLLLGMLALAAASGGAQYVRLQRQESALAGLIETSCREQYGLPQVASCRGEVQRRLAAAGQPIGGQDQGFLSTLLMVAQNHDTASQITALSYRNGVTDLRLRVPSVPALDEFVRRMAEAAPVEVRIQSANPGDAGIDSQLQIVARGT